MSAPSERSRVRRVGERGHYDAATIHAIIDAALVCHVGVGFADGPRVIPTAVVRMGDEVLVHGNRNSALLRRLGEGVPACLTVTHLDGLVVARSGFHCSMNYRSVVVHGVARALAEAEKEAALDRFVDHLVPGHAAAVRRPTRQELAATGVFAFALDEASAKVRTGPPKDDDADYTLDTWAGVVPLAQVAGAAQPDPLLAASRAVPDYISALEGDTAHWGDGR